MYKTAQAILGAIVGFGFIALPSANAFLLGDHEAVMNQAYAEFVACFPKFKDQVDLQTLVQADKNEDLNFLVKEALYSHFYNPHKKLNLWWREDSSGRIANLAPTLLQCRESAMPITADLVDSLGHMVHHLQDMAVPAHVVPVNHSMWDGFEGLTVTDEIASDWNCDQIAASSANEDLESILKKTAEQTLVNVAAFKVEVTDTESNTTSIMTGQDFWRESDDSSFGTYGEYGNVFGETDFDGNGKSLHVSPDAYRIFKQQQMKLAVRSTLRGMVWTFKP